MALKHILAAITQQADALIAKAHDDHEAIVKTLRDKHSQDIEQKRKDLTASKERKLQQLQAKARTHATSHKKSVLLRKKKELLDRIYEKVVLELVALSDEEVEPLLRACIAMVKDDGVIHPSAKHEKLLREICTSKQFRLEKTIEAKGGFVFVSATKEQDFTFEYLVEHVLRPKTELETSHALFT